MKLDEEWRQDRVIEAETDDEENQAQRACDDDECDSESDRAGPSRNHSDGNDDNPHTWPQTYRQSMDMLTGLTPSLTSFLKDSFSSRSGQQSLPHSSSVVSTLTKPLISVTSLDNDEVPTSTLPVKLSAKSDLRFSSIDLQPAQKCSYMQSVVNAFNVLCGIGILSTPYALKEGGWSSLILLVLLGIVTYYTGLLLQRCLESAPGLQSYPDIGQAAFGVTGRICIAMILYMELYSSCVEYLIMMSDNLAALFPNAQMDISGVHLNSYQLCAIISTIVILPTVWLRRLSLLSYISVGGVISLVLVVLCLLWVGAVNDVGFHPGGSALDLANVPVTIGIFGFCYGSHSVFPNLYSSMKEPSQFPSVLRISFFTSWLMYTAVAVCGFLMFGDSVKSQFTLNMPTEYVATKIAAWTVVVAPVTKYALTITPVAFGIEELLPSAQLRSHGISILIRTMLLVSTLVVALSVPYFGSVMALIGSLLVMLVAIVIPCVCYLTILKGTLSKAEIAWCYFMICVGVVCSGLGTYSAILGIAAGKKSNG